jgi:hypothetical protein
MARAVYLYVVMGLHPLPIAVFTVKHEMVTWLKRQSRGPVRVYRYKDGAYGEEVITEMDVEELLK